MATMNYNELTNCAEIISDAVDPMFYYDARFPERTSKLHMRIEEPMPASTPGRRAKGRSRRDRNAARYKTQPITFDEIKEVDEETDENKDALKNQFTEFSKSMEMLVRTPSYLRKKYPSECTGTTTSNSDTDSSVTSHDISPSPLASSGTSMDNPTSSSRERFHKRRKKRFHRSIEEVPDLEKGNDSH